MRPRKIGGADGAAGALSNDAVGCAAGDAAQGKIGTDGGIGVMGCIVGLAC